AGREITLISSGSGSFASRRSPTTGIAGCCARAASGYAAARAPRILFLHRRDCHHPAVTPLTAQPAQEYAHQYSRLQTIRLRPLVLAGHRNARRMDDMRLDPASNEPARQPEAVATSFIGQCNPPDRPASTHRLDAPPLDQSQQCRRIRLQLLQRLALDAGNNALAKKRRQSPRLTAGASRDERKQA